MTESKYNCNKYGNANVTHHIVKHYDENGIYLIYGSGCARFSDCFSCPLPDCQWSAESHKEGLSRRGRPLCS